MNTQQLLEKLGTAWTAFRESYAGLSESELTESGVSGDWSVKDIIAHVTWWENEALEHLPLILAGGRPPRYSVKYGGINAFNALMTEQKQSLSLADVLREQDEIHRRLIAYIAGAPAEQIVTETRFRRRIRLDAYSHYPIHAKAIRGLARAIGLLKCRKFFLQNIGVETKEIASPISDRIALPEQIKFNHDETAS